MTLSEHQCLQSILDAYIGFQGFDHMQLFDVYAYEFELYAARNYYFLRD